MGLPRPIPPCHFHHLEDGAKRSLFANIRSALRPGGVFINADEVLGPNDYVNRRNHQVWLAEARRLGASDDDIAAAQARMEHDRLATLEDQLVWLRDAGFDDVDCAYRYYFFVVYAGHATVTLPNAEASAAG